MSLTPGNFLVNLGILRENTSDIKFIYITNSDHWNYPFCGLNLLGEMFGYSKFDPRINKSPKFLRRYIFCEFKAKETTQGRPSFFIWGGEVKIKQFWGLYDTFKFIWEGGGYHYIIQARTFKLFNFVGGNHPFILPPPIGRPWISGLAQKNHRLTNWPSEL